MYIVSKHTSSGKCQTLPVIFKTQKAGEEYLQELLQKEIKRGFDASFLHRFHDGVTVLKKGANCFEKEYILQKLTYNKTIYAEGVPVRNYCGRMA